MSRSWSRRCRLQGTSSTTASRLSQTARQTTQHTCCCAQPSAASASHRPTRNPLLTRLLRSLRALRAGTGPAASSPPQAHARRWSPPRCAFARAATTSMHSRCNSNYTCPSVHMHLGQTRSPRRRRPKPSCAGARPRAAAAAAAPLAGLTRAARRGQGAMSGTLGFLLSALQPPAGPRPPLSEALAAAVEGTFRAAAPASRIWRGAVCVLCARSCAACGGVRCVTACNRPCQAVTRSPTAATTSAAWTLLGRPLFSRGSNPLFPHTNRTHISVSPPGSDRRHIPPSLPSLVRVPSTVARADLMTYDPAMSGARSPSGAVAGRHRGAVPPGAGRRTVRRV